MDRQTAWVGDADNCEFYEVIILNTTNYFNKEHTEYLVCAIDDVKNYMNKVFCCGFNDNNLNLFLVNKNKFFYSKEEAIKNIFKFYEGDVLKNKINSFIKRDDISVEDKKNILFILKDKLLSVTDEIKEAVGEKSPNLSYVKHPSQTKKKTAKKLKVTSKKKFYGK